MQQVAAQSNALVQISLTLEPNLGGLEMGGTHIFWDFIHNKPFRMNVKRYCFLVLETKLIILQNVSPSILFL